MDLIKSIFKSLYKKEIDATKQEIVAKEEELTNIKEEIQRLKESIKCLRQTSNSQVKTITKKQEEIKLLKNSLESVTATSEQRFLTISIKKNEIHRLQESENSLKQIIESQKNTIEEKERDILCLHESEESLKEIVESQKKTIEELKNENICLKGAIQLLRSGYDKEVKDNQILTNNITNLNTQLSKKDNLIKELELKLKQAETNENQNISNTETPLNYSNNYQNTRKEKIQDKKYTNTETDSEINEVKSRKDTTLKREIINSDNKEILTLDFPIIENENKYSNTSRVINRVFNHHSNTMEWSKDIFLNKSVEEISRLRFELEEAIRTGQPFLSCPCCGNLLKISVRTVGFGKNRREIQFFTHAVKNLSCDLKRDYNEATTDYENSFSVDSSVLSDLRNTLYQALTTEMLLHNKLSNVEKNVYINSTALPYMRRRLVDVSAKYKNWDLVFEIVTPETHISRVHDRDIFYLINRKQVLWIFGLNSVVDYKELSRSVAKDILFTNKRNVFVFDTEAQIESQKQRKLILKCNWLDDEGKWYFQIKRNGMNGVLITLDQLKFDADSCRPYYYDADSEYLQKFPTAELPLNRSRKELIEEITKRNIAVEKMDKERRGIQAFSNGAKWGFKFDDIIFIDPIFDSAPTICGNYGIVEKNNKFGVIDIFGDYILPVEYNKIVILPNNQILYADNENWMLFGANLIIGEYWEASYISVETISSDSSIYHIIISDNNMEDQEIHIYFIGHLVVIQNPDNKKWYAWDVDDESDNGVEWDEFELTANHNLKITVNGDTNIVDSDGELQDHQTSDSIVDSSPKNEDSLEYKIIQNKSGKYGVRYKSKNIIPQKYDFLESWGNNRYIAAQNNRYGIININGKTLLDFHYAYISMNILGKSTVKTVNSEFILYNDLTQVMAMAFGLKKVMRNGKWGVVDKYGNIVIDFIYDEITSYDYYLFGINGDKLENLNIYYPTTLGFFALNESRVDKKNFVTVGKLKLERATQTKKNMGLVECFYIKDWTKGYLPKAHSMKVNKYKKFPIDSIRKIPIDTTLRVRIIGIQGEISKDNIGKIIVMDNNQSIWAICNDEIKNIQRFEKKIIVSKIISLTKIEHVEPNTSIWRINKVYRRRFFNTELYNEDGKDM